MEEELIVDGKNVLKPVDLEENKKEIMEARKKIPSEVSLTHFKEKVALIFSANVKGEEANELVTQIQECFTDIHKRETVLFDNVDTIYRTVETIHKDNIEGIIVAIKVAQTAIKRAEDNIGQIKSTLSTLERVKTALKEDFEKFSCNQETINISYDDRLGELERYKSQIENVEHISDVDELWEQTYNLNAFAARVEKIEHLDDVDAGWDQLNEQNQMLTDMC
ncbi:MAG: hypothetical protein J6M39_04720 [Lachnospiraceae bacterium]|nr:hypothetical protein [Lachnospiraceae bacterium]